MTVCVTFQEHRETWGRPIPNTPITIIIGTLVPQGPGGGFTVSDKVAFAQKNGIAACVRADYIIQHKPSIDELVKALGLIPRVEIHDQETFCKKPELLNADEVEIFTRFTRLLSHRENTTERTRQIKRDIDRILEEDLTNKNGSRDFIRHILITGDVPRAIEEFRRVSGIDEFVDAENLQFSLALAEREYTRSITAGQHRLNPPEAAA